MNQFSSIFGTDGIRALAGESFLSSTELPHLATAIGLWIKDSSIDHISIASDPRNSSAWIKSEIKTALLRLGITITDYGIIPTPALAVILNRTSRSYGIMITASHNSFEYNGIKIMSSSGKISDAQEQAITDFFYKNNTKAIQTIPTSFVQERSKNAFALYQRSIQTFFPQSFLKRYTIVLDCANGATSAFAHKLFNLFEPKKLYAIHNAPNGSNINYKSGALSTQTLQEKMRELNADVGCAFDGDGDRLIMVNKQGIIKNGDDILALLSQHTAYQNQSIIVGTIMSNLGLSSYLAHRNKRLLRTAVGDKYVYEALVANDQLIGGEPSGHIVLRDYLTMGDGIFTALRCLESIQQTGNDELATFDHSPQITINLPIHIKKDLSLPLFADYIEQCENKLSVNGRMIVRYSGTEPVLRIMVEHTDHAYAYAIANDLKQFFTTNLT